MRYWDSCHMPAGRAYAAHATGTPFVAEGARSWPCTPSGRVIRGQGQVVGMVGEAGMGKSRLIAGFRRSLAVNRHTYLQGTMSYGQTMGLSARAHSPAACLWYHRADRPASWPRRCAVSRRSASILLWLHPYLLHLLGSASESERRAGLSPKEYQASTLAVLIQWSLQSSRRCPLVIEVEDLHWIDATSANWLAALAERLAGAPILLLVTFRPGYHPAWIGKSYATQVALSRLTSHDSAQVVQALLPTRRCPRRCCTK